MSNAPAVSFEFFPPTDEASAAQLWESARRLAPLQPRFVSVTYGADGSTRARTHDCVRRIAQELGLAVAPHLTCVGASRGEVLEIAAAYWRSGIHRLVALRGDAPASDLSPAGVYRPHPQGFPYASDLVRGLKDVGNFDITVAAYPEGHPETRTVEADLENLRRKVDAGANHAITQFFFDADLYLRYRDRCAAAGIRATIVPGILPIVRFQQMQRFAARCGATVPEWLHRQFDGFDDDPAAHRAIAAQVAIEQVQHLRRHGVGEFHFYTLNRAELTYAICHALGLRPALREAEVA